jgi:hypothetical protein
MRGTSLPPSGLSRREFLRRAGMAAVATAAAGGVYGATAQRGLAGSGNAIPVLDVSADVTGIAGLGDRLLAVGGHYGEEEAVPTVWSYKLGDDAWAESAHSSAFPAGTVLRAVTGVRGVFVAVGHTRELDRNQMIVDDETGRVVRVPIFATIPAIFSSTDGSVWNQVWRGLPGGRLGTLGAVTTTPGGGQALAVGSRFLEPGVEESYGLVALASTDGRKWESTRLLGVAPPRHGSVTLLARTRQSTLLGTKGIREISLYTASGNGWRRIGVPSENVAYVAAGATATTFVLAGVDDSAALPRFWKRTTGGWREIAELPGIPRTARLADIQDLDGSLVAAGSNGEQGFVKAIGD